ncbi:MAG: hypothetical protein OWQ50_02090 [Acidianus infernus]|nr:hypothetical protein [Acidianus infernus]
MPSNYALPDTFKAMAVLTRALARAYSVLPNDSSKTNNASDVARAFEEASQILKTAVSSPVVARALSETQNNETLHDQLNKAVQNVTNASSQFSAMSDIFKYQAKAQLSLAQIKACANAQCSPVTIKSNFQEAIRDYEAALSIALQYGFQSLAEQLSDTVNQLKTALSNYERTVATLQQIKQAQASGNYWQALDLALSLASNQQNTQSSNQPNVAQAANNLKSALNAPLNSNNMYQYYSNVVSAIQSFPRDTQVYTLVAATSAVIAIQRLLQLGSSELQKAQQATQALLQTAEQMWSSAYNHAEKAYEAFSLAEQLASQFVSQELANEIEKGLQKVKQFVAQAKENMKANRNIFLNIFNTVVYNISNAINDLMNWVNGLIESHIPGIVGQILAGIVDGLIFIGISLIPVVGQIVDGIIAFSFISNLVEQGIIAVKTGYGAQFLQQLEESFLQPQNIAMIATSVIGGVGLERVLADRLPDIRIGAIDAAKEKIGNLLSGFKNKISIGLRGISIDTSKALDDIKAKIKGNKVSLRNVGSTIVEKKIEVKAPDITKINVKPEKITAKNVKVELVKPLSKDLAKQLSEKFKSVKSLKDFKVIVKVDEEFRIPYDLQGKSMGDKTLSTIDYMEGEVLGLIKNYEADVKISPATLEKTIKGYKLKPPELQAKLSSFNYTGKGTLDVNEGIVNGFKTSLNVEEDLIDAIKTSKDISLAPDGKDVVITTDKASIIVPANKYFDAIMTGYAKGDFSDVKVAELLSKVNSSDLARLMAEDIIKKLKDYKGSGELKIGDLVIAKEIKGDKTFYYVIKTGPDGKPQSINVISNIDDPMFEATVYNNLLGVVKNNTEFDYLVANFNRIKSLSPDLQATLDRLTIKPGERSISIEGSGGKYLNITEKSMPGGSEIRVETNIENVKAVDALEKELGGVRKVTLEKLLEKYKNGAFKELLEFLKKNKKGAFENVKSLADALDKIDKLPDLLKEALAKCFDRKMENSSLEEEVNLIKGLPKMYEELKTKVIDPVDTFLNKLKAKGAPESEIDALRQLFYKQVLNEINNGRSLDTIDLASAFVKANEVLDKVDDVVKKLKDSGLPDNLVNDIKALMLKQIEKDVLSGRSLDINRIRFDVLRQKEDAIFNFVLDKFGFDKDLLKNLTPEQLDKFKTNVVDQFLLKRITNKNDLMDEYNDIKATGKGPGTTSNATQSTPSKAQNTTIQPTVQNTTTPSVAQNITPQDLQLILSKDPKVLEQVDEGIKYLKDLGLPDSLINDIKASIFKQIKNDVLA